MKIRPCIRRVVTGAQKSKKHVCARPAEKAAAWFDIFAVRRRSRSSQLDNRVKRSEKTDEMAGEKRVQEREEVALEQDVILVDIEGTTTSISFVKVTKATVPACRHSHTLSASHPFLRPFNRLRLHKSSLFP